MNVEHAIAADSLFDGGVVHRFAAEALAQSRTILVPVKEQDVCNCVLLRS